MFVGYKHIFVSFWPTNISLFPVVEVVFNNIAETFLSNKYRTALNM
jgi:hypothetical protein